MSAITTLCILVEVSEHQIYVQTYSHLIRHPSVSGATVSWSMYRGQQHSRDEIDDTRPLNFVLFARIRGAKHVLRPPMLAGVGGRR